MYPRYPVLLLYLSTPANMVSCSLVEALSPPTVDRSTLKHRMVAESSPSTP